MKNLMCYLMFGVIIAGCGPQGYDEPDPGHVQLTCYPCDGDGVNMALSTPVPIPWHVALAFDVCMDPDDLESCWLECPGEPIDAWDQGASLCVAPGEDESRAGRGDRAPLDSP